MSAKSAKFPTAVLFREEESPGLTATKNKQPYCCVTWAASPDTGKDTWH